MFRQRVFAISNGYPDGNDAAQLADDPLLKLACQRIPADDPLASQPTLSRFENARCPRTLLRMAEQLARGVLEHQQRLRRKRPPRRIALDLGAVPG
jgi:hypothetical protein